MNSNIIINPLTKERLSIFSVSGTQLLKKYVSMFLIGGEVGDECTPGKNNCDQGEVCENNLLIN